MKIGFVCNDIATEEASYTTIRLALTALEMGHEAWLMGVGDLACDPDDCVRAWARAAPKKSYRTTKKYLEDLHGDKARMERITVDELDILMLRNDPAADLATRPWAQMAGIMFGQHAIGRGVIVLNDPTRLAAAINKMYFQDFPAEVRPRTLITRSADDLRAFVEKLGGQAVLKPLQGSGGSSVFLVKPNEKGNLSQIIDAVSRDGYVVAQEYLPAAKDGDTRLFLMNGVPLVVDGKYAAFRRTATKGDVRSNLSAGGKVAKATVTDEMLRIADVVRPKLIRDGMFLVGLDIVGDKLMEINLFSPGGLGSAARVEGVEFTRAVIETFARKVAYRAQARGTPTNLELSML